MGIKRFFRRSTLFILAGAGLSGVPQFAFPAAADRPNIVVILADDYGWGSVGCYGAQGAKTPNLDRLAKEGRRFTNAYATGSVCSPTRYSLLTGRYFFRTPIKDGKVVPGNAALHVETTRTTIASLCREKGYATGAFGKWHLGLTNERVTDWSKPLKPGPLELGFDYFFGMSANLGNGPHNFIENHGVTGAIPGQPIIVRAGLDEDSGTSGILKRWEEEHVMDALTSRTCAWIEENHTKPFLAYFAANAVHEPIVPNPKFSGSKLGKYGDFINELDACVGRIMDTLDRLKLTDKTLVIFTSDNGGVVNPGNASAQAAIRGGLAINGPLRGGKHSEFEGGFREPFIVRWPGKVPADTVSDQVICLSDIAATLAELFGTTLREGNADDSFSILRALTEKTTGKPVRDHVIVQSAHGIYAIRMGDWKLIERADTPEFVTVRNPRKAQQAARQRAAAKKRDELYNLKDDPTESHDIISTNTERAAQMRQVLRTAREQGFTRPGAGTRAAQGGVHEN